MKILGRTMSGNVILEAPASFVDHIMAAGAALTAAMGEPPSARQPATVKPVRKPAASKPAADVARICLVCEKPLPADAHKLRKVHDECRAAFAKLRTKTPAASGAALLQRGRAIAAQEA
jgi:hypothetical protein